MQIILVSIGLSLVAVIIDRVDLRRNVERSEIDEDVELEECE